MSAEIVSLSAARADLSHPVLTRVETYWDSLRKGRPAPTRAEVDPRGLTSVLRHCFILERIAPGMARFRVSGQSLHDLSGLQMRGMPFSTLFMPESRDYLESVLEPVFSRPSIAQLTVVCPEEFKRPRLEGQMLILPLESDLGDTSRALGCLAMDNIEGARPRRLVIEASRPRNIPEGRELPLRAPAAIHDHDDDWNGAEIIELPFAKRPDNGPG